MTLQFLGGIACGILIMLTIQVVRGAFYIVDIMLSWWCILHGGDLMRLSAPKKRGKQPYWYRWLHGE